MGRWEPGARERLARAALDLYVERGFDETSVGDIAARAGVTERTFFRHFADKREVLCQGAAVLQQRGVDAIAAADHRLTPLQIMITVMRETQDYFPDHDFVTARQAAIDRNTSLRERELLKLATMRAAAAAALRARGVDDRAADLAADAGVSLFHQGFQRWVAGAAPDLVSGIDDAASALRGLTA